MHLSVAEIYFTNQPSGTGLGDVNVAMERLLVRFSIWVLRNLRSCIRSSTCLSSEAMRSCLLSSMHWSLVMVSSTFGGRPSRCEVARKHMDKGQLHRQGKVSKKIVFSIYFLFFIKKCDHKAYFPIYCVCLYLFF